MTTPLIVCADEILLEELLRLAAAAGVVPDVAHDAGSALPRWAAASVVLVGADLSAELTRLAPPRRAGVHLVAQGQVPDELFRVALALGAENVAELPRSHGWLIELLTDLTEVGRSACLTLGVIGGVGGAGATTFACALGQVAARSGPALVIDTDPSGPGVHRVLGMDRVDGVRWDALQQTTGRLSARSLREALPRRTGLGVLTWGEGKGSLTASLQPFALRETLSAGQRGHQLVVLDLPRHLDASLEEVLTRCDRVLVVTRGQAMAVPSTARMLERLQPISPTSLVVRQAGVDLPRFEEAVGSSIFLAMGDQRGLEESISLGLGPIRSRRGQLHAACRDVLASVTPVAGAA